jgi:hypothetical protein
MAVGQRKRLYSGARIFTGNYLSSPPQILRARGVQLDMPTLWERGDTEKAPSGRQGRCINTEAAVRRFQKRNGHLNPEVVVGTSSPSPLLYVVIP